MSGEQKTNLRYNPLMTRCRVSFIYPDGIPHTVEVQADSLYEAVAMAVAEFRADSMSGVRPRSHDGIQRRYPSSGRGAPDSPGPGHQMG
jgi:hypothetical protein